MTKKRVEAVDPENNLITFRIIEGDVMKDYKSFVSTVQATPKRGEPGSVVVCVDSWCVYNNTTVAFAAIT